MKFTNPSDGNKGQSITVTYRDTHTGGDVSTETVAPGQDVEIDMKDGFEVIMRGSTVHFDSSPARGDGVVAPSLKVSGTAVTEAPEKPALDADKTLTPADPAKVAEVYKTTLANASDSDKTAAGVLSAPALNAALADAGHAPVTAADRDAAHAAATA